MKKVRKLIAVFMMMCFAVALPQMKLEAKEETQNISVLPSMIVAIDGNSFGETRATTFIDTSIDVYCSSAGMDITIHTSTTKTASVIGVKDIVVQRKVGFWWETVATAVGGEVYNTSGCALTLLFDGATYNETYRISCVHYANVDGYRELEHTTENFQFVY